jgi:hypothetical protein
VRLVEVHRGSGYIRVRMTTSLHYSKHQFFRFLRRLKADGRSNMYGAVPYLMSRFGLDRETAFKIVCEWLDRSTEPEPITSSRRRKLQRSN